MKYSFNNFFFTSSKLIRELNSAKNQTIAGTDSQVVIFHWVETMFRSFTRFFTHYYHMLVQVQGFRMSALKSASICLIVAVLVVGREV